MISDGITPSSATNFLNQKAFLAASEAAMYSASIVESTTIDYLKLFQLIASPLHKNTNFDVDLLSSVSDIKSELVYPSTHNSDSPLKFKNKFLIFFKHLRIFFTTIQGYSFRFD